MENKRLLLHTQRQLQTMHTLEPLFSCILFFQSISSHNSKISVIEVKKYYSSAEISNVFKKFPTFYDICFICQFQVIFAAYSTYTPMTAIIDRPNSML